MVVYIDLLILFTILVNYVFIKTIEVLFHSKINIIRMVVSLLISVLSLLLFLLPYKAYFIIRYFIGIIIGFIAFKESDIKTKIIKIVIYYILNMCFIGTLVVFKINNIIPMILVMLYVVVLYIIEHYQYIFKKEYFDIYINNTKYKGFLDSGNTTLYQNIPIIYINKIYFNTEYKYITDIKVNTIGNSSDISIYSGPILTINKKTYNVYYAFDEHLVYDVLLNNLMRGNLYD